MSATRTVYRLAAEGGCDHRTVRRWLSHPESIRPSIAERLERALRELEKNEPPSPVPAETNGEVAGARQQ